MSEKIYIVSAYYGRYRGSYTDEYICKAQSPEDAIEQVKKVAHDNQGKLPKNVVMEQELNLSTPFCLTNDYD